MCETRTLVFEDGETNLALSNSTVARYNMLLGQEGNIPGRLTHETFTALMRLGNIFVMIGSFTGSEDPDDILAAATIGQIPCASGIRLVLFDILVDVDSRNEGLERQILGATIERVEKFGRVEVTMINKARPHGKFSPELMKSFGMKTVHMYRKWP